MLFARPGCSLRGNDDNCTVGFGVTQEEGTGRVGSGADESE